MTRKQAVAGKTAARPSEGPQKDADPTKHCGNIRKPALEMLGHRVEGPPSCSKACPTCYMIHTHMHKHTRTPCDCVYFGGAGVRLCRWWEHTEHHPDSVGSEGKAYI